MAIIITMAVELFNMTACKIYAITGQVALFNIQYSYFAKQLFMQHECEDK